jgi:NADH:ubiquinone oxidoreductase subunit E
MRKEVDKIKRFVCVLKAEEDLLRRQETTCDIKTGKSTRKVSFQDSDSHDMQVLERRTKKKKQ